VPRPQQAHWIVSAGDLRSLPPDRGFEVAFVGRSNSGKSSAINAITACKGLAFASKTPGRTQTINFFGWGTNRYLVDLPGYGYAKVSAHQTRDWALLISTYLRERVSLRGLVVVMDVRHPFTERDVELLKWVAPLERTVHVLLAKADKLSRSQGLTALELSRKRLTQILPSSGIQLFSATSGAGVAAARTVIEGCLAGRQKNPPVKGE